MTKNKIPVNPALAELIRLLAQASVQDYLSELNQKQEERKDGDKKN